ncbi:MAG: class II aldolase/adducin family protein [Candidatus Margulisiibacteriota bacterium]
MFERFKKAGEILFAAGCNDSHSGNISMRQDGKLIITSRLAMLSSLNKEDLVEAAVEGTSPTDGISSRDLPIHRAIYAGSKNLAVIHAHLPNALALCVTENKILPQDAKGQIFFPQGLSIIKPRQMSDAEEILKLIMSSSLNSIPYAAVIKGYGVFAAASSIELALEVITSLELSSKVWLASKLVGARQTQPSPSANSSHSSANRYDQRKRSAIPPGIGVMGRRTGGYNRRGM